MGGKMNVRDLGMNLGSPDQDAGYTVQHPADWNSPNKTHHTMFTGNRGEHYSFDADQDGNLIPGRGHLIGPKPEDGSDPTIMSMDPPAPNRPGVRVCFDPDCLWG